MDLLPIIKKKKIIDKVWLQPSLQPITTTLSKKINMIIYFEKLIVGLHIFYVFTIYVKFCANHI